MISIPLYRGGLAVAHVLIDECDAHLQQYRWTLRKDKYAMRSVKVGGKRTTSYMHREILGLQPGSALECDHINHNTLDNRRSNLRAVTHTENQRNRRPFKGGNQYTVRKRNAA